MQSKNRSKRQQSTRKVKPCKKVGKFWFNSKAGTIKRAKSERTNVERTKRTTMKRTNFYLNLVNNHLSKKIKLHEAYGNVYIKKELGNDTVFCGTKKQVYYYLVGVERLLNEQK